MSSSINVSKLVGRLDSDSSLLGSNEVNKLYGKLLSPTVFKDEVKIVMNGTKNSSYANFQANVLTEDRLKEIRQNAKGKCAYLHLGVMPIVIQSLLPSGNKFISGRCALVDTSRTSLETGLIDAFNFKFTDDKPYAGKMLVINKAIDINCAVSVGSVQIILEVNGIDLRIERTTLALTAGLTTVATNTAVVFPALSRGTPKWSLANVESIDEDDALSDVAFSELFNSTNEALINSGETFYLDEGKRFGFMGPRMKPVTRRVLGTQNAIVRSRVRSGTGRIERNLSRSNSDREFSVDPEFYKIIQRRNSVDLRNERPVDDKAEGPRQSFGVSLEQLNRPGKLIRNERVGRGGEPGSVDGGEESSEDGGGNGKVEIDLRKYS